MRAVVQRVKASSVTIRGKKTAQIKTGLTVLLGVAESDNEVDAAYLADKVANLRVFEDASGKMNLSVMEIKAKVLVVSQFTLLGDTRKGRRPDFATAAKGETAKLLYEQFVHKLAASGIAVETGEFQEHMIVDIKNDGPVTILLDSKKQF